MKTMLVNQVTLLPFDADAIRFFLPYSECILNYGTIVETAAAAKTRMSMMLMWLGEVAMDGVAIDVDVDIDSKADDGDEDEADGSYEVKNADG